MGDDRIYDNDSPQQVLDLRTVLYTQALTGARPVISVKKFLISSRNQELFSVLGFSLCCSQTSSVFPDPRNTTGREPSPSAENIMKSKPRSNDLIFDLITLCGTTRIPPSVPGGEDGHRNRFVHAEQKNAPLPQSILLCFPSYDGGRIPCSKSTSLIASGMPRKISSISLNFY